MGFSVDSPSLWPALPEIRGIVCQHLREPSSLEAIVNQAWHALSLESFPRKSLAQRLTYISEHRLTKHALECIHLASTVEHVNILIRSQDPWIVAMGLCRKAHLSGWSSVSFDSILQCLLSKVAPALFRDYCDEFGNTLLHRLAHAESWELLESAMPFCNVFQANRQGRWVLHQIANNVEKISVDRLTSLGMALLRAPMDELNSCYTPDQLLRQIYSRFHFLFYKHRAIAVQIKWQLQWFLALPEQVDSFTGHLAGIFGNMDIHTCREYLSALSQTLNLEDAREHALAKINVEAFFKMASDAFSQLTDEIFAWLNELFYRRTTMPTSLARILVEKNFMLISSDQSNAREALLTRLIPLYQQCQRDDLQRQYKILIRCIPCIDLLMLLRDLSLVADWRVEPIYSLLKNSPSELDQALECLFRDFCLNPVEEKRLVYCKLLARFSSSPALPKTLLHMPKGLELLSSSRLIAHSFFDSVLPHVNIETLGKELKEVLLKILWEDCLFLVNQNCCSSLIKLLLKTHALWKGQILLFNQLVKSASVKSILPLFTFHEFPSIATKMAPIQIEVMRRGLLLISDPCIFAGLCEMLPYCSQSLFVGNQGQNGLLEIISVELKRCTVNSKDFELLLNFLYKILSHLNSSYACSHLQDTTLIWFYKYMQQEQLAQVDALLSALQRNRLIDLDALWRQIINEGGTSSSRMVQTLFSQQSIWTLSPHQYVWALETFIQRGASKEEWIALFESLPRGFGKALLQGASEDCMVPSFLHESFCHLLEEVEIKTDNISDAVALRVMLWPQLSGELRSTYSKAAQMLCSLVHDSVQVQADSDVSDRGSFFTYALMAKDAFFSEMWKKRVLDPLERHLNSWPPGVVMGALQQLAPKERIFWLAELKGRTIAHLNHSFAWQRADLLAALQIREIDIAITIAKRLSLKEVVGVLADKKFTQTDLLLCFGRLLQSQDLSFACQSLDRLDFKRLIHRLLDAKLLAYVRGISAEETFIALVERKEIQAAYHILDNSRPITWQGIALKEALSAVDVSIFSGFSQLSSLQWHENARGEFSQVLSMWQECIQEGAVPASVSKDLFENIPGIEVEDNGHTKIMINSAQCTRVLREVFIPRITNQSVYAFVLSEYDQLRALELIAHWQKQSREEQVNALLACVSFAPYCGARYSEELQQMHELALPQVSNTYEERILRYISTFLINKWHLVSQQHRTSFLSHFQVDESSWIHLKNALIRSCVTVVYFPNDWRQRAQEDRHNFNVDHEISKELLAPLLQDYREQTSLPTLLCEIAAHMADDWHRAAGGGLIYEQLRHSIKRIFEGHYRAPNGWVQTLCNEAERYLFVEVYGLDTEQFLGAQAILRGQPVEEQLVASIIWEVLGREKFDRGVRREFLELLFEAFCAHILPNSGEPFAMLPLSLVWSLLQKMHCTDYINVNT